MSILMAFAVLAHGAAVAETAPSETTVETTAPAEAATPVETTPPAEEPKVAQADIVVTGEQDEDTKVTCRMEKPVGSSIKKRVCRTGAQAKAEAAAARSRFGEMRGGQSSSEAAAKEVRSN